MKGFFKVALLVLLGYIALAYWAGSRNVLAFDFVDRPLPTWSYTPRGSIAPIGTPGPADSHGTLEQYHNPANPLGYPNNTSYPLLTNNYPV